MNNAIASAFPADPYGSLGLSKREIFAAMAMQGLLSKSGYMERNSVATDAVALADDLLAALEKAP